MDRSTPWVQGLVAGALAYAVVAIFFALLNLVAGQSPFHTAHLLGQALGASGPGPEGVGIVLAANGVHLVISLAVGVAASWLITELEHHHAIWYAVLLAFLAGFILSIVGAGILVAEIGGVTTWPSVAVANTLAALVIGLYLWRMHPALLGELGREFGAT